MSASNRRIRAGGFTLIEILVAITLLTIVLAIVYGAYSSVVMSIERTRTAAERLKTSTFIVRAFTENLAQATEGWSPGSAYRTASAGVGAPAESTSGQSADSAGARGEMRFPFMGEIGRGAGGPMDELTFASTAPIAGGGTLPGQIKLCSYRLEPEKSDEETEDAFGSMGEEKDRRWLLVMTETPWTATGAGPEQGFTGGQQAQEEISKAAEDAGQKPVTRSVPVYAWDLAYFDGKQWWEEWDSQDVGWLPWCVRLRVKIDKPEDDKFDDLRKLDPEKDPSVLELFFTVPGGAGIHDAPPDYVRPFERETL